MRFAEPSPWAMQSQSPPTRPLLLFSVLHEVQTFYLKRQTKFILTLKLINIFDGFCLLTDVIL